MKFEIFIQKTALHIAVINNNIDIVNLLLSVQTIKANIVYILLIIFFIKF